MDNLIINKITFPVSDTAIEFYFSNTPIEGGFGFYRDSLPESITKHFPLRICTDRKVYTSFDKPVNGTKKILFSQLECISILKAYYINKISTLFRSKDVLVVRSFINQIIFYIPNLSEDTMAYSTFLRMALKININPSTCNGAVTISFEGYSRISKISLNELLSKGVDTHYIAYALYENKLYRYNQLPEKARYNTHQVYPKLNIFIDRILNTSAPRKKVTERYNQYYKFISEVKSKYIDTPEFKAIIPHSGQWVSITETGKIETAGGMMLFGSNQAGDDAITGLKNFGPYELSPHRHIKMFMIFDEQDTNKLIPFYNLLTDTKFAFSLPRFVKLPVIFDKSLRITFSNSQDPLPEILDQLSQKEFDPHTRYVAFYVSPFTKEELDKKQHSLYFDIKQALLERGIVSQVIERTSLDSSGLKFFISNIAIALLAKLNGVPWKLKVPESSELVIGVGTYKPKNSISRYVGSACCFSNDGHFKGFKAFPSNTRYLLAGSIGKAIEDFCEENDKPQRLIIHFYKKMSNRELKPIEQTLQNLLLGIPIVILSINKTETTDLVIFDKTHSLLLPESGLYYALSRNHYLLCINSRFQNSTQKIVGSPFPLKIKIESNNDALLDDPEFIKEQLQHVYSFSGMYWKSVTRHSLPVTVIYPSLLAEFYAQFKEKALPPLATQTPWFL